MKKYINGLAKISSLLIFSLVMFAFSGQIFKTSLQVIVRNELGNVEKGAKVTLYKTEEDYNASKNPIVESKVTDDKGKVMFDGLEPHSYYIQAEKDEKNNFGAGEKTPELDKSKLNKITIIISE